MVDRIIEFSGENRFVIFLLVFATATMGFWAMQRTPVDATPDLFERIRMNNLDVGGRVVEMSGAEYIVRGRGYVRSVADT